jgi:ribonuclease E
LLIVCIAALGVSSVHAQRADSDVQAKAREALRQKIAETQTEQPAPSAVAPAPAPVAPAEAPAQPAPQEAPKKKKTAAKKPAKTKTETPAAVAAAPAPAPAPAAEAAEVIVPTPKMDSGTEDKAREALHQKIQELRTQDVAVKPAPTKAEPQTAAAEPAKETQTVAATKHASKSNKYEFMDPSTAQPSKVGVVVANTKEGKLAELLRLYMADQITPVEYHAQRAKIIAAP